MYVFFFIGGRVERFLLNVGGWVQFLSDVFVFHLLIDDYRNHLEI